MAAGPPRPSSGASRAARPARDSGGRKLATPTTSCPAGDRWRCAAAACVHPRRHSGAARWERIWREAGAWLSAGTDWHILVRLCEAENLREGMRQELAERGFWMRGSMGQDIVNRSSTR